MTEVNFIYTSAYLSKHCFYIYQLSTDNVRICSSLLTALRVRSLLIKKGIYCSFINCQMKVALMLFLYMNCGREHCINREKFTGFHAGWIDCQRFVFPQFKLKAKCYSESNMQMILANISCKLMVGYPLIKIILISGKQIKLHST